MGSCQRSMRVLACLSHPLSCAFMTFLLVSCCFHYSSSMNQVTRMVSCCLFCLLCVCLCCVSEIALSPRSGTPLGVTHKETQQQHARSHTQQTAISVVWFSFYFMGHPDSVGQRINSGWRTCTISQEQSKGPDCTGGHAGQVQKAKCVSIPQKRQFGCGSFYLETTRV